MERQSGLRGGGLLNDGFSRGHCFFQCPTRLQQRQTLQGTAFLSEESLGSSLKCVCGGPLGPWNYCNFRAVNWLAFWISARSKVFSKCLARAINPARKWLPSTACVSLLGYLVQPELANE